MTEPVATTGTQRRLGYDLLRLVSICGVLAIHTFGALAANAEARGSVTWIGSLLLSVGFIWAVPVFVMLAGALSLREQAHTGGPAAYLARRAKRILPALILWPLIYLTVRLLVLREQLTPAQIVVEMLDARIYPHLYFLWLIAGLYLVAPVLAAFLNQGGRRRAFVTAGAALGLTLVVFMLPGILALKGIERPIQLGALTIWIAYVGYFLAGYALSLVRVSRFWVVLAGVGIVLFGGITLAEAAWPGELRLLRAVATPEYLGVVVAALAICMFVFGITMLDRISVPPRLGRWLVALSEASFGVYLVHLLVLLIPYALLPGFRDNISLPQAMLAYCFIVVVSFAIALVARRVPGMRLIF